VADALAGDALQVAFADEVPGLFGDVGVVDDADHLP
jgi:hypothetical protein